MAKRSEDDEENEVGPSTPEYHHSPDEVGAMRIDYSTRAPEDWVISGPLGVHGGGPGRRFASVGQAEAWVRKRYGDRVRARIVEATLYDANRWAWLIRGEKS